MPAVVSNLNLLDMKGHAKSYLDPEIAGEGESIVMDDSEGVINGVPAEKLVYPDLSKIKTLRKYFNRTGYQVYPAWIYHPVEQARIVKNAAEADEYGVKFRMTTPDERAAFGVNYRWDYVASSEWRTSPVVKGKRTVDPDNLEGGKNYIPRAMPSQDREGDVARTVAAVLAALKTVEKPSAPANVDAKQWQEFQEFLAFRESQKTIEAAMPAESAFDDEPEIVNMHGDDPREHWLAEADRLGVKVDK